MRFRGQVVNATCVIEPVQGSAGLQQPGLLHDHAGLQVKVQRDNACAAGEPPLSVRFEALTGQGARSLSGAAGVLVVTYQ